MQPEKRKIGRPPRKYNKKEHPRLFGLWSAMRVRCANQANYDDVMVSERWNDFQVFCEDIMKMDNWDADGFELDKDLKRLGNKTYSRKTCSFVPVAINRLLNQSTKSKGLLPQGVVMRGNSISVVISRNGKRKWISGFTSVEEAHDEYIRLRVKYIRRMAKRYRDQLHPEVYANLRRNVRSIIR